MAITLLQQGGFNWYAASCTVKFPYNTLAGSLLVVMITFQSQTVTVTSMTDDAGNTYQEAAPIDRGAGSDALSTQIWYAYNNARGVARPTISITWSSTCICNGSITEHGGVGNSFDPLGPVATNAVSSMAAPYDFTCGSVTPPSDNALVVAVTRTTTSRTKDAGNLTFIYGGIGASAITMRHGVQTTATAEDGFISWDASAGACGSIAVFLETPAATPWVDIANFIPTTIDFSRYPGGAARVACEAWSRDSGVTLQVRLWDGTTSYGESDEISSTTPTDATFTVTGTGVASCWLQVTADVENTDLFVKSGGLTP